MPWQDAYFHVEEKSPGVDASAVLEMLKKQDRVKYNEANQVFMYEVCFATSPFNVALFALEFCRSPSSLRSSSERSKISAVTFACTRARLKA